MSAIELRVTVLDAAFDPAAPMWGDATDGWRPPAIRWLGLLSAAGVPVVGVDAPPDDNGGLLIVPDPDAWPDAANDRRRRCVTGAPPDDAPSALARVRDALGAVVSPDLQGLLVLRLDDPGAAVRVHLDGWKHDDVADVAWTSMFDALRGFGRASVFCCPGWVDDHGRVVDSRERNPDVWRVLDRGAADDLWDLECHGYTHMDPDLDAWVSADDRFTSPDWYRELWPPRRIEEPAVAEQESVIAAWQQACGPGTSLVAPGEAWGTATVTAARRRGLELFCSWSICRLQAPVPTWGAGIGSPYLDEASVEWFTSGLPVVGYWHDRDMAVHGADWFPQQLTAWRDAGATRAWSFADLATAYRTPVDAALVDGDVVVRHAPPVPLVIDVR